MVDTEDLVQLRLLNLELLRQLWAGQVAVQRSVAKAAAESNLDSSSNFDSEMSQETSSASSSTSCPPSKRSTCSPPDVHRGDPCGVASLKMASLPAAKCQYQESLGQPRPHSSPLLGTLDLKDTEPSAGLGDLRPQETQALRSILSRRSKLSKPRVTFCEESAVPERSWRLRPYLGYDWIA
ncbi:migration and invasion-inhibitory protein-like, partial [Carlito syrichta]|uniref:Migration and invasion-inhibitory protein-like n=1 Tax=Carlito syrichta TaxID=1868482 RepID=A0A1U7T0S3_CARSF